MWGRDMVNISGFFVFEVIGMCGVQSFPMILFQQIYGCRFYGQIRTIPKRLQASHVSLLPYFSYFFFYFMSWLQPFFQNSYFFKIKISKNLNFTTSKTHILKHLKSATCFSLLTTTLSDYRLNLLSNCVGYWDQNGSTQTEDRNIPLLFLTFLPFEVEVHWYFSLELFRRNYCTNNVG